MCPDALTKSRQGIFEGEHDSIGVMAKEYAYAGGMSESLSTNGHTNGHGVHRQQILNRHLADASRLPFAATMKTNGSA